MPEPRWATFDCYGTLVDWNAGIAGQLGRLFGDSNEERLLAAYHEIEPRVQRENPAMSYRRVMALVLAELAAAEGSELPVAEEDALRRSLPGWPVFPEVPSSLAEAHARGWKPGGAVEQRPDLIDASLEAIGVPFEAAIVASEVGSYKPATATGARSTRPPAPSPAATSTSRRATSTTSCRRASSASRPCGSSASARAATRRRHVSCPT